MKKYSFTFLFLSLSIFCFSQITVSTVTDQFPGSGGVKLGPDGHIYIGNFGDALGNANGTQIWRYRIQEDSLEVFATGLSGASGNDFASNGDFFQSNIAASSISKVTPAGGTASFFVSTGISGPVGIAIDDDDNLFVCNCSNNTIRKVTPAGFSTQFASSALLNCPNGITFDHEGMMYVSNFSNGSVLKINSIGQVSVFKTMPGANNGHITYNPVDSLLYVASHGASRIYSLSLSGDLEIIAGSGVRGNADGTANSATFSRPNGIAATITGDTLFVNSSIPLTNVGLPLNPSVLRMIIGVQGMATGIFEPFEEFVNEFKVFPNPTTHRISLEFDLVDAGLYMIQVFDLLGRPIVELLEEELPYGMNHFLFDIDLEPGMYEVHLSGKGNGISRMLTIMR